VQASPANVKPKITALAVPCATTVPAGGLPALLSVTTVLTGGWLTTPATHTSCVHAFPSPSGPTWLQLQPVVLTASPTGVLAHASLVLATPSLSSSVLAAAHVPSGCRAKPGAQLRHCALAALVQLTLTQLGIVVQGLHTALLLGVQALLAKLPAAQVLQATGGEALPVQ
jgi:hypothetical protein